MGIQQITSFNPGASNGGSINNTLSGRIGTWIVYNDSGVSIRLSWLGNNKLIPAGVVDTIVITQTTDSVVWTQAFVLSNASASPVSLVNIDGYTSDVHVPGTYPFTIPRLVNQGNSVNSVSAPTFYSGVNGNQYQLTSLLYPNVVYDDYDSIANTTSALQTSSFLQSRTMTSSGQSATISVVSGTGQGVITGVTSGGLLMYSQAYTNFATGSVTWTLTSSPYFALYDLLFTCYSSISINGSSVATNLVDTWSWAVGADTFTLRYVYPPNISQSSGTVYPASVTVAINASTNIAVVLDVTSPQLWRCYRTTSSVTTCLRNDSYPLGFAPPTFAQFATTHAITASNSLTVTRAFTGTVISVLGTANAFAPPNYQTAPNSSGKFVYRPWIQIGLQ